MIKILSYYEKILEIPNVNKYVNQIMYNKKNIINTIKIVDI